MRVERLGIDYFKERSATTKVQITFSSAVEHFDRLKYRTLPLFDVARQIDL